MNKGRLQQPLRVFVGIAAFNAEKNIRRLISSLCTQEETTFVVDKIFVYSDRSTDSTVELAKSLFDSRISVAEGELRKGFAGVVKYLLHESSAELTLLLNDDIIVEDRLFIHHLVDGYLKSKAGLICGNPQPLPSSNFISRAINSSFRAYHNTALRINNGHNMHTYDGKVMMLSHAFKNTIEFPLDMRMAGNVDSYVYFSCLKNGYSYYFVNDAVVLYASPTTMKDFLRWFIRNNANEPLMREQFGALVDRQSSKPRMLFMYHLLLQFSKNPLGCLFIFCMSFYIGVKAQQYAKNFSQTWDVVKSTKELAQL